MIECTLEKGVNEAVKLIVASQQPALVAVYGVGDAGRTSLINEIAKRFPQYAGRIGRAAGTTRIEEFLYIEKNTHNISLQFFHCGAPKEDFEVRDDPNTLAKRILQRECITIGIYRPDQGKLRGHYDILICNPDTVDKPPHTLA
jgi:hypothetical protein